MTLPDPMQPPAGDELVVLVGPTATGKTELALRLAQDWNAEIVSADSVQIYRHFDLGSGKPTAAERQLVPHHLVDCVDPLDPLDAARFAALADQAIAGIRQRGRAVIVCGGTFLWTKALLYGLAPSPPADPVVRGRHLQIVEQGGRKALHAKLAEVDPASAERLAPNDYVRVSRALEVFELSGKTQTAWHAAHQFREQRYRARLLGVRRDRAELDARIRERTKLWLEQGWVEEGRGLLKAGFGSARAMASVGYRQVHEHLAGALPEDKLLDAIVSATRVFVRRQRTWLRDEPSIVWLEG